MGGRIGITDRPGGGSIFWFELSLGTGASLAAGGIVRPVPARRADRARQVSGHILLAEDNAINRDLATLILEGQGYIVATAHDGLEAVEAAAQGGLDLILMDVQMPRLDGLRATQRIRALGGRLGAVPIIAMTANAMAGDQKRCLDAGMQGYVSKPIEAAAFLATVAQWIAPGTEAPAPIDEARLKLLEGLLPPEGLAQLFGLFLDSRSGTLLRLRQFERIGDLAGIRAEAHILTATAGNLGARRLHGLAEQLHAAGSAEAPGPIGILLDELQEAWEEAARHLDRRASPPVLESAQARL